jgi:hypothetical protein
MKLSFRVITKTQAEFWVRVFKLEPKVLWATRQLSGPRKELTMPVIAEYVVDPGLKWVYCLCLIVDSIGLTKGFGYVYGCDSDPADQKEVYDKRDRLADQLIQELEKGPGVDEAYIIPEGKEIEETDLSLEPTRIPTPPPDPPRS